MKRDDPDLAVVIMAGGAGTRFWPVSTEEMPKQFLSLFGDKSLLQLSFERVSGLVPPERVLVLTNASFVHLVREQLPEVPEHNVIGEPQRKDTAAAVALAAFLCKARFGDPVIATLTADHLIEPVDEFQRTLVSAARMAEKEEALYTMGIVPAFASTAYGYLERGALVLDDRGVRHFQVKSFREKPDQETAQGYVGSGDYYWNSGMFVWSADAIISELETHLPGHVESLSGLASFDGKPGWEDALAGAFERLEPVSIDFGVMEKAGSVRCVEARFKWSDVGGWLALDDHLPGDRNGNRGRGEVVALDAGDNLVFCKDPAETVMLIGVRDLVAVRAGSRTLIVAKDRAEDVKKLVKMMEDKERGQA